MRMACRAFVIVRMIVRVMMLMIVWMRMGMFLWCVSVMAFDQHARLARADAAAIYGFNDEGCAEVEGCSGLLEERRAGVLMEAFSRVSRLPA